MKGHLNLNLLILYQCWIDTGTCRTTSKQGCRVGVLRDCR